LTALVVALGLVCALLAVLVVGLLRSHAEVLRALHDQGVHLGHDAAADAPAPARASTRGPSRTAPGVPTPRSLEGGLGVATDIAGTLPQGGSARVALTGVPHLTLVAFLSSTCGTCSVFWEAFDRAGGVELPGDGTRLVIVTQDPDQEQLSAIAELAPPSVTTVMSSAAWDDHDVPVSPYFLLVDGPSGQVVGEGSGTSWPQVADLLGRSLADRGLTTKGGRTRREVLGGAARSQRVDRTLADAGIEPGDPSLYPAPLEHEESP
jgi:hypothetical protein